MTAGDEEHRTPVEDLRAHAEFHARENSSGIGAAVVRSAFKDGDHLWECIVTDGNEWHYIEVIGPGLGAFPPLSAEEVERGVERFAAELPSDYRLRALLNANPLHIGRGGQVTD